MSETPKPEKLAPPQLKQLTTEQLVVMILEQQKLIDQLERGSSPAQAQTQTQQPNYLTTAIART
ncbi:MAG: hypothetical protein F6J98_36635 [Moorea sp. SIO4G2]|nr:hypothetical protein [Moorena sp. SIO4G2]